MNLRISANTLSVTISPSSHCPLMKKDLMGFDIHDGEYCMSLECDYSKKLDVKEDQKELQELTYEIDKELNEALGKPNLQ